MTDLSDVISNIQGIVEQVVGVRSAPDMVPDLPSPGVMSVAYPDAGVFTIGAPQGNMEGLHNITLEVISPRGKKLRTVLAQLFPFGTSIPLALAADPTLGGLVSTFGDISYSFGASPLYGENWLGWVFSIQGIKMTDTY